jgi:2-iminoacetate synthase
LHLTLKGLRVELEQEQAHDRATGQFEIDDKRPVDEIARILKTQGFDPVWKDWDPAILTHL